MSSETGLVYLEGHISVTAAIEGGYRDVSKVYVRKERIDQEMVRLRDAAHKAGIEIVTADGSEIANITGNPKCTDAAAEVGERRHIDAAAMLNLDSNGWYAALDGVEDPYNFGGALRALYAAGAAGVFVGARNWFSASTVVARASAGASELIASAVLDDIADIVLLSAQHNRQLIVAGEGAKSVSLFDTDMTAPMIVVIGGERRGVSKPVLASNSKVVRIPYGRADFQSLGTISASTAIGFEILRQRSTTSTEPRPARSLSSPDSRLPRTRSPRKPLRGF
jgi:23S rRNA (guanosine2251-2'-O)-methyltransferase